MLLPHAGRVWNEGVVAASQIPLREAEQDAGWRQAARCAGTLILLRAGPAVKGVWLKCNQAGNDGGRPAWKAGLPPSYLRGRR